jgi:oligopeptide/dipeptide ABC transporter ATP-binding protein
MGKPKLLEVKNLVTHFHVKEGVVKALNGVDFEVYPEETLGIVGESGCGKSQTALSIMRLIKSPPGKIMDGQILFNDQDLLKLDESKIRSIRGNDISMIFQEPMSALDPVYPIGKQIAEAILIHEDISRKEAMNRAVEMLRKVGLPSPEQRVKEYPHQLSGGMGQRVMLAIALSCNPILLIADEPTTSLDVTTQAQVLELLDNLKASYGMSIIMITHDLAVIAEIADRVAVMYAGEIFEYTDVRTLFENPKNPYTWGLMGFVPRLDQDVDRLVAIPGIVPNPLNFPPGCRFHNRCPLADEKCKKEHPNIQEIEPGHQVRCWHTDKIEELKKRKNFG